MPLSVPKRLHRVAKPRQLQVIVAAVISALMVLAIFVVVVKVASDWLAATDGITDRNQRAEEISRARTVVLALLAGGLAAIGAYYTHLNFGLNRQGQITERFTRAVDQLGSDSSDVRIGGIYALERLARESKLDHGPIVEILTAFVRERAPMVDEEEEERRYDYEPHIYPMAPGVDVQAALTVLGRRNLAFDPAFPWHLDLAGVYLPKANLRNASLRGADLSHAVLDLADLSRASLDGAMLVGTRLTGANLTAAHLISADLRRAGLVDAVLNLARLGEAKMVGARLNRAHLQGAFLRGADLTDAVLKRSDFTEADAELAQLIAADLEGALLTRTDLSGADLSGADLSGADLSGAHLPRGVELQNASYSHATRWPDDFDLAASGAVLVKDS